VVSAMLSTSTKMFAPHIPHGVNQCRGGGAENWQVSNGTVSFFTLGAKLNATKTTPFKVCDSFVEGWRYGIAIAYVDPIMRCFFSLTNA
jgi:hypothetical protein